VLIPEIRSAKSSCNHLPLSRQTAVQSERKQVKTSLVIPLLKFSQTTGTPETHVCSKTAHAFNLDSTFACDRNVAQECSDSDLKPV